MNAFFLYFFLPPIIVGVVATIFLLVALIKANKKNKLELRSYATGYGICAGINIAIFVVSLGYLGAQSFIIFCGPIMIFSFMLTKKIIQKTAVHNVIINFIYKSIAIVLIWIIAFAPFSFFSIAEIISIPKKNAAKQELLQLQEEISSRETYADLTQFGLGIYKLEYEGDPIMGSPFLWNIAQPEDGTLNYGHTRSVYNTCWNLKDNDTWDDSNRGKDVTYDVKLYEGTYIIIIPDTYYTYDEPRFYVNICKELSDNVDLFQIVIYNQEVITKLQELPGEKFSRKELIEKLGKTKWEDVPRQS